MLTKNLSIALVLLGLVACSASAPDETVDESSQAVAQQSQSSDGYRCEMSKKTGSNIPQKRCTTRQQRDAEYDSAKELLKREQMQ